MVYKRLDHFKEVLSQFQGKEGKEIPREVVDKLKQNINKQRTTITLDDVKLGLRKLKLNKYIENILYIHHVLSGTDLPYIKREIEDKMVRLFKQLDRVFGQVRSKVPFARTSFMNYYFTHWTSPSYCTECPCSRQAFALSSTTPCGATSVKNWTGPLNQPR